MVEEQDHNASGDLKDYYDHIYTIKVDHIEIEIMAQNSIRAYKYQILFAEPVLCYLTEHLLQTDKTLSHGFSLIPNGKIHGVDYWPYTEEPM